MATAKRETIPNQIFVGLPWKNVKSKYEKVIVDLEKKYPLHFTIIGRNDGKDAQNLFEIIKSRISSSSYAIFDATDGNANVSLEYGYAEGIDIPRAIFLSDRKGRSKDILASPIISDLHGMRRVQYKTVAKLRVELDKFCRDHDFTKKYEKALAKILKGKPPGEKKSGRALVLKIVRFLDGKSQVRRVDVIQHLQGLGYSDKKTDAMLKKLHALSIVKCTVGKSSKSYIA